MTALLAAAEAVHHWSDRIEWDDAIDPVLVCRRVQVETPDVRTFVLEATGRRYFRFDPGQYLTLQLEIDGERVERCYTISSSPTRPYTVSITVKRVPGGLVSNWLHDTVRAASTLRVQGPLGLFSVVEHPAPRYLFLSGGSGVTPLMSMTRALFDLADPADVVFVHSARTPRDIVFRRELATLAAASPALRVVHVCERDSEDESWEGHSGRLGGEMLGQIAPDFREREVLACGPEPYLQAVRALLAGAGFDMARYHEEQFTIDALPDPAVAEPSDGEPTGPTALAHSIEFRRSGATVRCDPRTTILQAAQRAGLNLPSSCGQGLCGTCKAVVLSGAVEMNHKGGIRPREIAQGKALLCCSTPREDIVVDL